MIRLRPVRFPLSLPALSAAPPVEPDSDLLHAREAGDRQWWLGGRRVHADFHGLRGLVGARFGGALEIGGLAWGPGAPAAVWITPRAARFERTCPAGSFLETVWMPERLPGLLVEVRPVGRWLPGRAVRGVIGVSPATTSSDGDTAVGTRDLGIAGDATARWCEVSDGHGVLITALDPSGPVAALAEPSVDSGSVEITVEWQPDDPDASLTIAILAGEPSAASLRSLVVTRAHARRADPASEALRTRTGVDEVDDGVAWAWTRMRDRALDGAGAVPTLDPADAELWVRTALAAGLTDAARAVLADDPRTVNEVAAWEAWASGIGSGGPLDDLAARVGPAADRPPEVRRALFVVAERGGQDAWATALDEASSADASTTAPGAASASGGAPPSPGEPSHSDAHSPAGRWRERIAADPAALGPDGWRILGDLVDDVLGWQPDAATGRMHLTPSLPAHWTRFVLEGLRGGELRMRLELTRDATGDTWRFAPMAGAVPATLILRLPLPDRAAEITVDGVPAELDIEHDGGRLRAPIQLELDRDRVVHVGGASGGGDGDRVRMVLPTVSPPS